MGKVNILNVDYEIVFRTYDEDKNFKRRNICGYCDSYSKLIVICDMKTYKGFKHEPEVSMLNYQKETLRHEIVHAFLYESGLGANVFAYDGA